MIKVSLQTPRVLWTFCFMQVLPTCWRIEIKYVKWNCKHKWRKQRCETATSIRTMTLFQLLLSLQGAGCTGTRGWRSTTTRRRRRPTTAPSSCPTSTTCAQTSSSTPSLNKVTMTTNMATTVSYWYAFISTLVSPSLNTDYQFNQWKIYFPIFLIFLHER